jgi:O-succinylbenzoate synthase
MAIRRVRLDELEAPLVEPFETSFGVERRRRFLVVSVEDDRGHEGWGECVAVRDPLYSSEAVATARWMITEYLVPLLFAMRDEGPEEFVRRARALQGHPMAKAAVEMALWDLRAKRRRRSLARELGGRRSRVEVGVSVGIQPTVERLVRRVGEYLDDGYRRIKLKVKPGWDEAPVGAVRRAYPDVRLWVDANQAYPASAASAIARWAARFSVEQVEQPFAAAELDAHSRLARRARFRVCLDESITGLAALEEAVRRRAVTSVNVKPGRVGGHSISRELETKAQANRIPAWVGGMLETGIGRAHNVALATRPNFRLPADLSASDRYYREELVDPPFELGPGSTLGVPKGPGIGVEIREKSYRKSLRRSREFRQKGR